MMPLLHRFAQIVINPKDLNVPKPSLTDNTVQDAMRLAFALAGAIAVIIIVIGGFKYVLSQGNPAETAKAKNTILYALVGLIVCIAATAIVTFFIGEVG